MQSFHLHSVASPNCANISYPNSSFSEPQIPQSPLLYPSPRQDAFSDALLSLRKCTEDENPIFGSSHHCRIIKLGIESDVFVGNSLLNMYSKCDQLNNAQKLFDQMPRRTVVSWTSMMSAYYRIGKTDKVIMLFRQMLKCLQPNEYALAVVLQACALIGCAELVEAIHCYSIKNAFVLDDFLQNCLIDAYSKSGMLEVAEKLLHRQCNRSVVSWTSVISGCIFCGKPERALVLFCRMLKDGICPNEVTMITVLQACMEIGDFRIMEWIHGLILKWNWLVNHLLLNSLIAMYSMNGCVAEGVSIFCCFCFGNDGLYPSSETMANLVQGCVNLGSVKLGKGIHGYLIKHGFLPCLVAENSLINTYAKSGQLSSALLIFRKMLRRDVISWNTLINGFVKNGEAFAALALLVELHREGCLWDNVAPDFITVLASLEGCSELALLLQGQVIHSYAVRTGLLGDIFVQNALIDMYAKSGRLDFAENVYTEMHERDVGSWNSMIAAYGMNGDAASALNALSQLRQSVTIKPNAITLVNVLAACAHAGLLQQGFEVFNSMERTYGVKPSMEHFACVVDMLGRAGKVEEAENFIRSMPIQAGPEMWGALLGACVLTGNIVVAERAAEELGILKPDSGVWRVALANAYASVGKWEEAAEMRAEVRGCKELGGWSSLSVGGRELSFKAGDTECSDSAVVYEVIACLREHMRLGSCVSSESELGS